MSTLRFQKILVTGARGQLANAILQAAPEGVACIGVAREELDIADALATRRVLEAARPDLVINGAAYNLVDKAESEGASDALKINAHGVANLAIACRNLRIPIVHFSTDFVFDGAQSTPYLEADATSPQSVYAASKLCGENIALATSEKNWAIRVSRLFGFGQESGADSLRKPTGNFPAIMLKLAQSHSALRVVNDQVGSPSYTPDLARGVWQLLHHSDGGLFHLSNAGEVAFDEYARAIFEIAKVKCEVISISSEEYNAPAKRPEYSTLDNSKAHAHGVSPLRNWKEALREYLALLAS